MLRRQSSEQKEYYGEVWIVLGCYDLFEGHQGYDKKEGKSVWDARRMCWG
jgi:hypothetical protein